MTSGVRCEAANSAHAGNESPAYAPSPSPRHYVTHVPAFCHALDMLPRDAGAIIRHQSSYVSAIARHTHITLVTMMRDDVPPDKSALISISCVPPLLQVMPLFDVPSAPAAQYADTANMPPSRRKVPAHKLASISTLKH